MLINWHSPEHVYLVCGNTDFRKGIDGLAMIVAENFGSSSRSTDEKIK
ncbi:IS66 family insertion sequence element accessory protein TnpB [Limosilactobacillus reuteri]|nr:IS66 family insertion sequence element accessory protein TnpB [Limosilactobacillus reuteri]MCT3189254.1 hypothetical protein [Limosilactobacillus reuteri]MCT3197634.1 hypothetical protein [Limosilactobacillus reuteri]